MAESIVLTSEAQRAYAIEMISGLALMSRIEIKRPRRTLDQNAKWWAMLSELSEQLTHNGRSLTPKQWARLFMDSLGKYADMVPALDGVGLVNIGKSSSDLEKADFSDLIELTYAFAAQHGVTFKEPALQSQKNW